MTVRLTVGSLLFSSDPSDSNLGIDEGGLLGWFSSPGIKTQPDDRANADGVFGVTNFYRAARAISIPGLFTGTGDAAADALTWRSLSGILSGGTPATITVEDPAGELSAEVMLTGDGCVLNPLTGGMASYEISFLAFDPIRYGDTSTPSTGLPSGGGGLEFPLFDGGSGGALYYGSNGNLGRITLTNGGTADVYPIFTITGQLDAGFYIQCLDTGDVLQYDRVVPVGTTITINTRTGEVLVGGVSDASTYLTRDEFFPVPAMGSVVVQFNPISTSSGSPTMTATEQDGWW